MVDNLKDKNSGMSVYSFLHYVTGKVQLKEALTSTRRHWSQSSVESFNINREIDLKEKTSAMSVYVIFTLCHGQSSIQRGYGMFVHQQGDIGRQFEKKDFWRVCIFIYTLCHGQSSVERGFNINKETLVDNLKEKTSGMPVYSFLHYVTGKVQLNEALTSTRRYWSTICKKSLLACLYIHFYIMSLAKFSWTRL